MTALELADKLEKDKSFRTEEVVLATAKLLRELHEFKEAIENLHSLQKKLKDFH